MQNLTPMTTSENIRAKIFDLVQQYHQAKFAPKAFDLDKDLVHYAGRVFDADEIVNLIDAGLDFCLTAHRRDTEAHAAGYNEQIITLGTVEQTSSLSGRWISPPSPSFRHE